ncbi:MAG TPA: parallel beta-helix domain-containing protein [Oligoflexus sp.]|uniref:parallel beta-helix domain-containing protein n=1 Tax=Oligoflexus sp. TaxID=1971216 RepID=UPI002D729509|nr:parallel beta-helix domain-containing protein [Oligoflexus sp.]HYX32423.1 parallel beta-helix domain-containing protein [Oligoflexus sp.]
MTRLHERNLRLQCAAVGLLMLTMGPSLASAKVWNIPATAHLEFDAQEALFQAQPGDTVVLPAGRFAMSQELSIITPFVTLKGAGMNATTLIYGANAGGPQAIISYADQTVVEDLGVVDHPGDGIKIIGADGATIRRVKVEWTKRGTVENGAYGLYPVESSNVLVEDNVVIGASDAGVYVGQSKNIVVRRNRVEYNVAGIEIENSEHADVYANVATNNTGGILVFNLPNLMVQGGRGTRVYQNFIYENNYKNFAPPGNSVATVPQGTGVLVMANDDVEIFRNTIERHNTTSIAVVNYSITQREVNDPKFDSVPEHVWIHDNVMRKAGGLALIGGNQLGLVAAALNFPHRVPHITYDGMGLPDGKGGVLPAGLTGDKRLCIGDNDHDGGDKSYFGNMQLFKQRWWSPVPGEMDRSLEPHTCTHPAFASVQLSPIPPLPEVDPTLPTEEDIARLCENEGDGINWDALAVDCPRLSHYNLFTDAHNPLSKPQDGGYPYDLTTALFSDYSSKDRVLFLPPGASAQYHPSQAFSLPVGAVIAKTFYFPSDLRNPASPQKLVETRLLVHREKGWIGLTYLWAKDRSEAKLIRGGSAVDVSWIDTQGQSRSNTYRVPNMAQCVGCHLNGAPIGVKAGYLNKSGDGELSGHNQLEFLIAAGRLVGAPDDLKSMRRYPIWNDPSTGTLADRAQTYLDINCAHCHSPSGKASTSALFLQIGQPAGINSGLCKPPVAAGRGTGGTLFDIVPGQPEKSLLVDRMNSIKAAVKMPEIAKTMVHTEGVSVVSEWIRSLPGQCQE